MNHEDLQVRYSKTLWSDYETLTTNRLEFALTSLPNFQETSIPLSKAISHKIRKSIFGAYLDRFNPSIQQNECINKNKLGITLFDLRQKNRSWTVQNNLVDDALQTLQEMVEISDNLVTLDKLFATITCLRMVDYFINKPDDGLLEFRNLRVLILSSNWLKDLPGSCLPRSLRFLELYRNELSDVRNLCKDIPKLTHLGLGRNKLGDTSSLEEFKESSRYPNILSLDLSENSIQDLDSALIDLEQLQTLSSLQLEGNPCYVFPEYKTVILNIFPDLLYLDGTEILDSDRLDNNFDVNPGLFIKIIRLIGLPQPKKEKSCKQTFHFEIDLPLLEEMKSNLETEEEIEDVNNENVKIKNLRNSKTKTKEKSTKSSKRSNDKKNKKKKDEDRINYEAALNEYDKKLERINGSFKTDRTTWSKTMTFPDIHITPPNGNLQLLADTLRSKIKVRLIYLKWLPPSKLKKGKRNKAPSKSKKEKHKKATEITDSPKEPEETILKKVTVANFYCDLRFINWSDETIDYYWADHKDVGVNAIPTKGSLAAVTYSESKGKGQGRDSKNKRRNETASDSQTEETTAHPNTPKCLTCQIGFGLNRS